MLGKTLTHILTSAYRKRFRSKPFVPGETPVPVSGKVFDHAEILSGVEAVTDGWWTEGRFVEAFEKRFSAYLDIKYVNLANSGSSANLLALASLTSRVFGDKAIKPGDEIITLATGFPTTVNPIFQLGCTPVFIDNDILTKNASIDAIRAAINPKTRAIMMAHTLGNPLPLEAILKVVQDHQLWFVEDSCDALGGTYAGKKVGTFGHVSTFSFYPAHQLTMGEGGAVVTKHPLIHRAIRQFRDWGRDCWCDTGHDNTCKRRFDWQLGDLPYGYDHKYIYSQIGYNLKLTDMQAAIGLAQMDKLDRFIKKRKANFAYLTTVFKPYDAYFILTSAEAQADPSWFGFMVVVKPDAPFTRLDIVNFLESKKIGTRSLFGGNLLKHPAYKGRKDIRIVGKLTNSDLVMENGFWIGVFPGITSEMLSYIKQSVQDFMEQYA